MLDLLTSRKYLPASRFFLPDSLCHETFVLCHTQGTHMVLPGSLQVGIAFKNSHFLGFQEGFTQTTPSLRNPDSRGMKQFEHLD